MVVGWEVIGGRKGRQERERNNSRQGQTEARPQCASAAAQRLEAVQHRFKKEKKIEKEKKDRKKERINRSPVPPLL